MGGFEVSLPTMFRESGPDPSVTIGGLAPGHYTVTSREHKGETSSTEWTNQTRELDIGSDTGSITMGDGEQPGAVLSGTVVLDNGTVKPPMNSSIVLVSRGRGRSYNAQLGVNGAFKFDEAPVPGTYEIYITNVPRFILRGISAKGARVVGRDLTIDKQASDITLTIMASRGVGEVTGTAMAGKAAMAGAMIVLVPEHLVQNSFAIRRDQSDSDGTFTLSQVVPGRYTVLALRDGWDKEWNNPQFLKDYLARGTPVVVEEKTKQDIRVLVQ
jgi:hypothetical protein